MRQLTLLISALGTLLFGTALLLSWVNPLLLERAAREVLRLEVERRVGAQLDALDNTRLVGLAEKALRKVDAELAQTRENLRRDVPARVAQVVADMMQADCECRRRMVERARAHEQARLEGLEQVRARLTGLVESAYGSVRDALLRELRIVSGSNALAFALLGVVMLRRPRAGWHLLPLVVVLVGAVCLSTAVYVLNQNWLHTVLFADYVGWGYSAYLALVAALLADVVLNRARVCTRLVEGAAHTLGYVGFSLAPC